MFLLSLNKGKQINKKNPLKVLLICFAFNIYGQNKTQKINLEKPETIVNSGDSSIFDFEKLYRTEISNSKIKERENKYTEFTINKNLVSINLYELFNGTISFNYLREFKNNYFNIYVPLDFGVAQPRIDQLYEPRSIEQTNGYLNGNFTNNYKLNRKNFEIGIGLHFQTTRKQLFTHFIGPCIAFAQFSGTYNVNVNYGNMYYPSYVAFKHGFVVNRYYLILNNGFLFRINPRFNILLLAGLGYYANDFISNNPNIYVKNSYQYSKTHTNTYFKLGMSLGYKF